MPKLPQTVQEWNARYGSGCSIHDFDTAQSASKMTEDQFFALKVIWPAHKASDLKRRCSVWFGVGQHEVERKAKSMRTEDFAWASYLEALEANASHPESWRPGSKIPIEMGPYGTAFHNQLQVNFLPISSAPDVDKVFVTPMVTRSQAAQLQTSPSIGPADRRAKLKGKQPATALVTSPSPRASEESLRALGSYTPASLFQPSPLALRNPLTQDEETINRALINFLDAHNIHEERNADWDSTRKEFVFQSPKSGTDKPQDKDGSKTTSKFLVKMSKVTAKGKGKDGPKAVRFVARTDGHLKVFGPPERSAAIIEVKARLRPDARQNDITIEMQESAQMALWIFQEPQSHWMASADTMTSVSAGNTIFQ